MADNDIMGRMHSATFTSSGIATGFLHEITGLQLDTGNSQQAKILTDRLLREYNRKCHYAGDEHMTGLMVLPVADGGLRPTLAAAAAAAVDFGGAPAPSNNIVQFAGDPIVQFAGDNIVQF